jgi:hypothetical protein
MADEMIKRISMEEFEAGLKVERVIYTSQIAVYTATFKHYVEKIKLNIDDKDDLSYLDEFAYGQLKRQLLDKMNSNV